VASELRSSIRFISRYRVSGKRGSGVETEGTAGELGGELEDENIGDDVVKGGLKTRSTSPLTMEM
jgi:hypothetical protein